MPYLEANLSAHLKTGWASLVDYLSTEPCYVCKKKQASDTKLCNSCEEDFLLDFPRSIKELKSLKSARKIYYAANYSASARKFMKDFKFKNPRLMKFWGNFLFSYWYKNESNILEKKKALKLFVTEVPVSTERRKSRKYNQSALIAKQFVKNLWQIYSASSYKYFPDLFSRINEGSPLFKQGRIERQKLIEGAFLLNKKYLGFLKKLKTKTKEHRVLIVIDDITTTGSTLSVIANLVEGYDVFDELILLACTGNDY